MALCSAGADVDARCGCLPSPREMARLAITSGDVVSAARGTLVLAALTGKLDREDCYADLNVLYRAIKCLLVCRLNVFVGPAVSAHHAVQKVVPATSLGVSKGWGGRRAALTAWTISFWVLSSISSLDWSTPQSFDNTFRPALRLAASGRILHRSSSHSNHILPHTRRAF